MWPLPHLALPSLHGPIHTCRASPRSGLSRDAPPLPNAIDAWLRQVTRYHLKNHPWQCEGLQDSTPEAKGLWDAASQEFPCSRRACSNSRILYTRVHNTSASRVFFANHNIFRHEKELCGVVPNAIAPVAHMRVTRFSVSLRLMMLCV